MSRALTAGAIAAALVGAMTSGAGPGLDPDAMAYLGAATSIVRHGTIRVPSAAWWDADSTSALTRWPPGFPVAIAIPERLGASPLASRRLVLAMSALITATILFLLLEQEPLGAAASAISVAAVFVTPAIVGVHLSILSEPLFLACLMLTLLAMLSRARRPILAGVAAGACMMVRYAGLCAPVAVVLWVFLTSSKPLRQRFVDSTKAALVPTLLLAAWIARVHHVTTGHSGIQLNLYGNLGPTIREAISTLADWAAPGLERWPRAAVALLVWGALAALAWKAYPQVKTAARTGRYDGAIDFLRADLLLLGCYLIVLILSRLFVGGAIPFDFRLLAPAILLATAAIVMALGFVLTSSRAKWATVALMSVWIAGSIYANTGIVADAVTDGLDFAGSDWRESETIAWVKSNGAGRTLFSNWPPPIYFHAGRVARNIPDSLECRSLEEFRAIMQESHGALVAFDAPSPDYPLPDSIAHVLGLREEARLNDGKIWSAPAGAVSPLNCG